MPSSVSLSPQFSNSNSLSQNEMSNSNNDMTENNMDHDEGEHQYEEIDDDHNNENVDTKQRSIVLTRKVIAFDDNWIMKPANNESKLIRAANQGEATLLEVDDKETPRSDSAQFLNFSSDESKTANINDKPPQTRNFRRFSPRDLSQSAERIHSTSENRNIQSSSPRTRTNINKLLSPIRSTASSANKESKKGTPNILDRSNSSSKSRSRSPTRRQTMPPSKTGAFRFVAADEPKTHDDSKTFSLSNSNSSSIKDDRKRLTSSDEEENDNDPETDKMNNDDLKLKLKEEKRHGKKKGELLNKLHQSYEELLERYAHAENTIDQLRFQPKLCNENTPRSTTSEGHIHVIQPSATNMATLRSSGVYHSTTGTPLSSIRPMPSSTITTPIRKSVSPLNTEELNTSTNSSADLLTQIKALIEKMKTFLTLMNTDQLSLAEQKQVYDSIKQDYEKLTQALNKQNQNGDASQNDPHANLNEELETMKQLLKEIVQRITENLLGKSANSSSTERQTNLTNDLTHSSQISMRSSLCNHDDLMNQYQKLLNAVNTENKDQKQRPKVAFNEYETNPRIAKNSSHDSSQSSLFKIPTSTANRSKPYVYGSADSDNEEQSGSLTPVQIIKGLEPTTYQSEYVPTTSVHSHQPKIEEPSNQQNIHSATRKKSPVRRSSYENVDNSMKLKRKTQIEQKKTPDRQRARPRSPLRVSNGIRPTAITKKRVNDYDSGIGTYSMTKTSHDSKLFTNTMDESHFQSFEEEQESTSSSYSSGTGSPHRFDSSSANRRQFQGRNDYYSSDVETGVTGSFDPLPRSSLYTKQMYRSDQTWQPKRTLTQPATRVIPLHRSASVGNRNFDKNYMKHSHSFNAHTNNIQDLKYPRKIYRSSIFINRPHTNQYFEEKLNQNKFANLYLDSKTGIIYRDSYHTNQGPVRAYHEYSTPATLYPCAECECMTTYQHCHYINSRSKRSTPNFDDLGYESGHKPKIYCSRCMEALSTSSLSSSSSSDSDSDIFSHHRDMIAFNEIHDRIEKVLHNSENLSRHIDRQLKLALAAI